MLGIELVFLFSLSAGGVDLRSGEVLEGRKQQSLFICFLLIMVWGHSELDGLPAAQGAERARGY